MAETLTDIQRAYERTGDGPSGGLHYDSEAREGVGFVGLHFPDPATCSHLDRVSQGVHEGKRHSICLRCKQRWAE